MVRPLFLFMATVDPINRYEMALIYFIQLDYNVQICKLQARSFASVALRKGIDNKWIQHLDYFTGINWNLYMLAISVWDQSWSKQ